MTGDVFAVTCTGPVSRSELGFTLPHEHVLINQMREYRSTGLINDFELCLDELRSFESAGGRTIVDVTTAELSAGAAPDPAGVYSGVPTSGFPVDESRATNNVLALTALSRASGINIILGTGHYREPYLDGGNFDTRDVDAIAQGIVRDLSSGFPNTEGIRAGVIGEIGSDGWYITAREERSFRAAARASLATSAPITTHAARWPVGIAQLDLLEAEGVPAGRIVVGHADTVHIPEYHLDIAKRGAYVEFDAIRSPDPEYLKRRARYVVALRDAGLLRQVLLSHDVCESTHQSINGGCGFTLVGTTFAKMLREAGLSDEDLNVLFVENPGRVFAWHRE